MRGKPKGKTATEVNMYDELQERNKLVNTVLQELAVVLRKVGDLIDILTRPTIEYHKEFKFKV